MYITPKSLLEIEETLTQFGRNDSAAGAILSVTSRVCDVLPTIAQVAELLHPTLNLADRVTRLLIRLNLGVPVQIIDLAYMLEQISQEVIICGCWKENYQT